MPATTVKPAVSPVETRQPPAPKKAWATGLRASAIIAVGLFLALNLSLFLRFGDDKVSHDLWNGAGSIDIAIKAYSKLPERPRIVLLGSSLMMYPFWAIDKQYDPAIPDIFRHRQANVFEARLEQRGDKPAKVYSFAIFGQMVSDAYIYVNEFLKAPRKPDYIVLGIAPRDFHDHDLPAPMSTLSFRRLVGLNNFSQYADLYLPEWQDKFDWLLGRICYLYGHRWRLQHDVARSFSRLYSTAGDTTPTNAQAGFSLSGTPAVRWKNSLAEYKRRYSSLTDKDVNLQFGFLDRLLDVCHHRHIKAVVVNMPLSDLNRALLPSGFYNGFSKRMAVVAAAHQAVYLDLGSCPEFTHEDFWDSTHLNHLGGQKLITHILPCIR